MKRLEPPAVRARSLLELRAAPEDPAPATAQFHGDLASDPATTQLNRVLENLEEMKRKIQDDGKQFDAEAQKSIHELDDASVPSSAPSSLLEESGPTDDSDSDGTDAVRKTLQGLQNRMKTDAEDFSAAVHKTSFNEATSFLETSSWDPKNTFDGLIQRLHGLSQRMTSQTEKFSKDAQESDEKHAMTLLGLEKNDRALVNVTAPKGSRGSSDSDSDNDSDKDGKSESESDGDVQSDSDPSSFLEEDPDASDKAKDADDDGDWAARESELQSSIKDEENELTHMAKKFHDNALREEQFSAEFKKAKMDKEARVESAHS